MLGVSRKQLIFQPGHDAEDGGGGCSVRDGETGMHVASCVAQALCISGPALEMAILSL